VVVEVGVNDVEEVMGLICVVVVVCYVWVVVAAFDRFQQAKLERQKQYAGVDVCVKNLSDEIDDDRSSTEFANFGQITSAQSRHDQATKSKGFGFVYFTTPKEATKAVTEMNTDGRWQAFVCGSNNNTAASPSSSSPSSSPSSSSSSSSP